MKIKCDKCDRKEAWVFCCADEAALCLGCDELIHAANELVSKHHRVLLSSPSSLSLRPKCDICQDTIGYFLCLEDRALLCRNCDFAIHTMNSFVSGHQRFLLTGAKVGLESTVTVDKVKTGGDSLATGLFPIEESSQEGDLVAASEVAMNTENVKTGGDFLAAGVYPIEESSQEGNLMVASEVAVDTENARTGGDFLAVGLPQITARSQEGNPVVVPEVVVNTENVRTRGDFFAADLPQVTTYSQKCNLVAASEVVVDPANARTRGDFLDANLRQVAASSQEDNPVAASAITCSQNENILDFVCSSPNNPYIQDVLSKVEGKVNGSSEWWKIPRSTEEELLNHEWDDLADASCTVTEWLLWLRHYSRWDTSTDKGISPSDNVFNISDIVGCSSGYDFQSHLDFNSTKCSKI